MKCVSSLSEIKAGMFLEFSTIHFKSWSIKDSFYIVKVLWVKPEKNTMYAKLYKPESRKGDRSYFFIYNPIPIQILKRDDVIIEHLL